jgi:hypothetical protein
VLEPEWAGTNLAVAVTAFNRWGTGEAQTAPIQLPPAPVPPVGARRGIYDLGPGDVGSVVTAPTAGWSNATVFTAQWVHCRQRQSLCTPIPGETSLTHVVQLGDSGRRLGVIVTASNGGWGSATGTWVTRKRLLFPPVKNRVRPSIEMPERVGGTAVLDSGVWSESVGLTYQWYRCDASCSPIAGATGTRYTTTAVDIGARVEVQVTATGRYTTDVVFTHVSKVVLPPPKPPQHPPVGTPHGVTVSTSMPRIGEAITTTSGTWAGKPTSFSYQWQRCFAAGCSDIPGATASSYTVSEADVRARLRVEVWASNTAGTSAHPEISDRTFGVPIQP